MPHWARGFGVGHGCHTATHASRLGESVGPRNHTGTVNVRWGERAHVRKMGGPQVIIAFGMLQTSEPQYEQVDFIGIKGTGG